jgi:hypothetical protein
VPKGKNSGTFVALILARRMFRREPQPWGVYRDFKNSMTASSSPLFSFSKRCDQRTCGIGWRGGNSILKALRLAPQTIVDASVGFDDGIASEIYIVMEVAEHNEIKDWHRDRIVVVRLSDENPSACHDHYKAELTRRSGAGEDNRATVAMDRCVSRDEFTSAVAINAGCLTRVGGCKTIPAMLPRVFGRH